MMPRVISVSSAIILKRFCRANYSSKAETEQRGFFLSMEKGVTLKSPGPVFNLITWGIREEKLRKQPLNLFQSTLKKKERKAKKRGCPIALPLLLE